MDQSSHPRQNKYITHNDTAAAEAKGELEASTTQGSSSPRNSQQIGSDGSIAEDGERFRDLWMHAYKSLRAKDPKVVTTYEAWLTENLENVTPDELFLTSDKATHHNPASPCRIPRPIESVIRKEWEDQKIKKLVTDLSSKPVRIRECGEKVVKFILWSESFVFAAIVAQPYTALAWSGV